MRPRPSYADAGHAPLRALRTRAGTTPMTALLRVALLLSSLAVSLAACGGTTGVLTAIAVTPHPFAVILCQAQDDSTKPAPLAFYQRMFTDSSAGLANVFNFFVDQSYGTISLAGTTVLDWTPVTTTTANLRKLGRAALAQTCADTAKGKVTWAKFKSGGVIAVWNIGDLDSGSGGGAVSEDGITFPLVNGSHDFQTISFYTHEMLHDFGLDHALGPYPDPVEAHLLTQETDQGETHTFGAITQFEGYGDCWTIMGCGEWTFPDAPYVEAGPGLGAAQQDYLGWMPKDRILTYNRAGTVTVTLAPAGISAVSGTLLVKIPVGTAGYYTVEYIEKSGWNRNIKMDHAVLIHEVRADSMNHTWLVSRNIYGAWLPGQVFLDPANKVRVSIESYAATATITLSPGGSGDGGKVTCDPIGYLFRPDAVSSPEIGLEAPLDGAHAVAGLPTTLQATVRQLVGTGTATTGAVPLPDGQITWFANGVFLGSGSSLLHTFSAPGDYTIEVAAYNTYCLLNKRSATLHVDAPAPALPSVAITQPVDGTTYYVDPPDFRQPVTLVASGTSDVATFTWTDTLTGFLGTGEDLPVTLKLTATGNCAQQSDTITVRSSTSAGAFSTASVTVYLKSTNCIR